MAGLFDLTGQRALITGGGQGIGLGLARALGQAGAQVVLNGRRPEALAVAAAALSAQGISTRALAYDVTDATATRAAIDGFEGKIGPIDILIANAGLQHRAPLADFPPEAFERLFQTNVAGVFHSAQSVARHMIARKRGKIIAIASVGSALARASIAPYVATKGAVANLVKGMAADWAPLGLNCNALAPGYIRTPLNAALLADPEFTAWIEKRTPQGRWGEPDDLGGTVVFLASRASDFVNGQTIYVDGGITAVL